MNSSSPRPKWWQVYFTLPLLVMLFVADSRLKISNRGHQVMQIGIVLLVYGLIHVWLKANAGAFSRMDREQDHERVRVIRMPVSQLSAATGENRLMIRLPDSEIRGLLSDTFEMDYINATSVPVDEVPQEVDKE